MRSADPRRRPLFVFLVTSPFGYRGGYERFVRDEASQLTAEGFDVAMYCPPVWLVRAIYSLFGDDRFHGRGRTPELGDALRRIPLVEVTGDALVYAKNDVLDLAIAATLLRGKHVIVGFHTALNTPGRGHWRRLRQLLYSGRVYRWLLSGRSRWYHALDSDVASWVSGQLGSERVFTVGNSMRRIAAGAVQRRSYDFGFLGRLTVQKGIDLFLGAVGSLPAGAVKGLRMAVAGEGEYSGLVKQCRAVEWLGYVDDPLQFLASCKWLVVPSRWEQQPYVLIEAGAVGTPCIVPRGSPLVRHQPDRRFQCELSIEGLRQSMLEAIAVGGDEYAAMVRRCHSTYLLGVRDQARRPTFSSVVRRLLLEG